MFFMRILLIMKTKRKASYVRWAKNSPTEIIKGENCVGKSLHISFLLHRNNKKIFFRQRIFIMTSMRLAERLNKMKIFTTKKIIRWNARNNKAISIKRHVEEALKIIFLWTNKKIIKRMKRNRVFVALLCGLLASF